MIHLILQISQVSNMTALDSVKNPPLEYETVPGGVFVCVGGPPRVIDSTC